MCSHQAKTSFRGSMSRHEFSIAIISTPISVPMKIKVKRVHYVAVINSKFQSWVEFRSRISTVSLTVKKTKKNLADKKSIYDVSKTFSTRCGEKLLRKKLAESLKL